MAEKKTPMKIPAQRVSRKAAAREPSPQETMKAGGSAGRKPLGDPHLIEIQKAVAAMTLEHVQCRDFGHSWRPFHARWIPADNLYESQLRCSRCTTIRTRFLSRTGEQLSSGYDYAEGYTTKGLGRLSGSDRNVIRLQSIQSVLVQDTAQEA